MEIYYYIDKNGKKKYIDEEEKRKKIRERKLEEQEIKKFKKLTLSLLTILLISKNWENNLIFDRNKQKLKHEIFILNAVEKIKGQLLGNKDTELILTQEERSCAGEIQEKLKAEGINLTHNLKNLSKNNIKERNLWEEKLKKDKVQERGIGLERS